MVAAVQPRAHAAHEPVLMAPHYAASGDGMMLHRYFDDSFTQLFMQELQAGSLRGNAHQAWRQEDRFAGHSDHPTLRLPVHRTFYMVCCEVACAQVGSPPFDPARIASAGFAVRRQGAASHFSVVSGVARGWERGDDHPTREPDLVRRLVNKNFIPHAAGSQVQSGELTHPLQKLLVSRNTGPGRARKHCMLFGYLPLGGSYAPESAPFDAGEPGLSEELPWPFGIKNEASGSPPAFTSSHAYLVRDGQPTEAFFDLLRLLVERYRIGDAQTTVTTAIRGLLEKLRFVNASRADANQIATDTKLISATRTGSVEGLNDDQQDLLARTSRELNLLGYLDAKLEQKISTDSDGVEEISVELIEYLADSVAKPLDNTPPTLTGLPGTTSRWQLFMLESEASDLRDLLFERWREEVTSRSSDLMLPRFGQGADDVYRVVPFLRYLDECGREQVKWGPASEPFRVAAPFDPEASRPHLVQLPSFNDLKRGMTRGVSFLTPSDVAKRLDSISMDMPPGSKAPSLPGGFRWIYSFSIPIVTFVAFLLLMIVVNLLNLFLGWLPWVVLRIPIKVKT